MAQNIKNLKQDAIKDQIARIALGGTMQRSNIYKDNPKPENKPKEDFRIDVAKQLKILFETKISLPGYTESDHFITIQEFCESMSQSHKKVLRDKKLRIGIGQKLINLYWKFCWLLLQDVKEPFHCPFDSIMINKLKGPAKKIRWTQIDKIADYEKLVKAAEIESKKDGSIAKWELRVYLDNNNYL
jgi:hypothetical protein